MSEGEKTSEASLEPPNHPRSDARRLVKSGFHALLDGATPSSAELARRTGLPEAAVAELLAVMAQGGRAIIENGRLLGIGGISVVPTPHRLRLGRRHFFTWCAYDAVGIPAAMGRSARVLTPCGQCARELDVRVNRGRVPPRRPERGWFPDPAGIEENPLRDFCPLANLFCSEDHVQSWRGANGGARSEGRVCTLDELAEAGRRGWATVAD